MPFVVIVDDVVKPLYVPVTVELPSLPNAGAVYVTAVLTADVEAGETVPIPEDGLSVTAVAVGSAVPAVVYFAVSVSPTVLWPSPSTVADEGLSVTVIPFSVIVDDTAVSPL